MFGDAMKVMPKYVIHLDTFGFRMVLIQTFLFLFGNNPIHKIGIIPVKSHQLRTCSPALARQQPTSHDISKLRHSCWRPTWAKWDRTTRRLGPQPCFLSPRTRSVWVRVKAISSLVGWQKFRSSAIYSFFTLYSICNQVTQRNLSQLPTTC